MHHLLDRVQMANKMALSLTAACFLIASAMLARVMTNFGEPLG